VRSLVAVTAVALVGAGGVGGYRYFDNFWVYRGFAPPRDPGFVSEKGTAVRFYVKSAAIGGLRQPVDVYLPPGYATDTGRRYPVIYLLHGFPGKPGAFLLTVQLGVQEDVLLAEQRIQPVILVMPFGSTGQFTDKEWADGVGRNQNWATFVARDVVHGVDARYRTIATGAGRAIAGLSEGGYGALNIALHHPGEFGTVESWSGYELADPITSIFDHDAHLLALNSPLRELPNVAHVLRRRRAYFWFYVGASDGKQYQQQNSAFAAALGRAHIAHHYFVVTGGHTWAVWRAQARPSLLAATSHLSYG
jgi:enterochelin esterase-like enzyme